MSPPYLPQELLNIVTDFLQGDISTLCSCSLVSHSWTNPAHRILFRHFRYTRCRHSELAQFEDLLTFFGSSPTICEHVKVLKLDGRPYNEHPKMNVSLIEGLFATLPSLRELHLQELNFVSSEQTVASGVHTSKKALQVLSMESIHLTGEVPLSSLIQLFQSISSVDDLHINYVRPEGEIRDTLSCLDHLTHLQTRSIAMYNHTSVTLLFANTFREFPLGTIQSLELEAPSPFGVDLVSGISDMLKVIGPGLQDVTFVFEAAVFGTPNTTLS